MEDILNLALKNKDMQCCGFCKKTHWIYLCELNLLQVLEDRIIPMSWTFKLRAIRHHIHLIFSFVVFTLSFHWCLLQHEFVNKHKWALCPLTRSTCASVQNCTQLLHWKHLQPLWCNYLLKKVQYPQISLSATLQWELARSERTACRCLSGYKHMKRQKI